MFIALQARLQQYVNRELSDVQGGFRKGRGTRDQIHHLLDHRESKRVPEKHLLLFYWLHQSLWQCGSQQTVENFSRDGNTRPSYLHPEKSVCRSRSKSYNHTWNNRLVPNREGVHQGCILWSCLFNLYAEYIMRNILLDEVQAGIKVAGRNINNLWYADDTTLMAENEKELKSLLLKMKEESEKADLKLNIRKLRSWHPVPSVQFNSVQLLSHVRLFATPWIAARQASLSISNSQSSLRLTSIESVMPSSHLILCNALLLLPPIPPSIRVFSNESTLHMRWPKYWSFSFSIIPSKEIPGLISFRMDWLDSLQSKGLSRVFSNTTVQKHQFFSTQLSSQSDSHIHTWLMEKPKPWLDGPLLAK